MDQEANEEFKFGHIDILAFLEKSKGTIEYRITLEYSSLKFREMI